MGQILSHSEVEAILTGLDLGTRNTPDSIQQAGSAPTQDVTLYDFEHPVPLQKSQLDTLRLSAASVSQAVQKGLSKILYASVAVNFVGVEQSTFREYLATSEQPCCLAVFESTTGSDTWLLDISRSLAFTMIDCLLGGQPSTNPQTPTITRPFTDVETHLIEKAVRAVLPELTGGFARQNSLNMTRLISDGTLISESTSNEAVALISFEVICGASQGLMQMCIPWKHVAGSFDSVRMETAELQNLMRSSAVKLPVTATVRVARLKLSTRELSNLSPGDILLTDALHTSQIGLEVDGRVIFQGTPGQIHDRKVIQLTVPVTVDEPGNHR